MIEIPWRCFASLIMSLINVNGMSCALLEVIIATLLFSGKGRMTRKNAHNKYNTNEYTNNVLIAMMLPYL